MALSNHMQKNSREGILGLAQPEKKQNAEADRKSSTVKVGEVRKTEVKRKGSYVDTSGPINILRIAKTQGEESEEHKKARNDVRTEVMNELVELDEQVDEIDLKNRIEEKVADRFQGELNRGEMLAMVEMIYNSIMKLGELQPLMDEPGIGDICVNNGGSMIFADRGGIMYLTDMVIDDEECKRIVDRIAGRAGKRVDESHPTLDCTLYDGSRVNVTVFPMAVDGTSISIRRFPDTPLTISDLVQNHMLNKNMAAFIQSCVIGRCNIIISGGTSSGKTTFLNVLSNFVPDNERVITIEDATELQIKKPNLVRLEARDANAEGQGRISIRDCVVDTLRMRPDRIIVGECRSDEVVDMLQAMNTGHDGSLTTIHSNSVRDCLIRLETMFLMAGVDMPVQAIRRQICSAVDIIVQIEKDKTGHRHVAEISEVLGMEKDTISTNSIYKYDNATGRHIATGVTPRTIVEKCAKSGKKMPVNLFAPSTGQS